MDKLGCHKMITNVLLLILAVTLGQAEPQKKRKNIIFILADDLGWNDVGFHGMTEIPTPNIDALAADGVILNNYYGAPMCTPSRTSLMTGKYPSHVGMQHFVIPENGPWGLPLNIPTLANHLQKLGYVNRLVGKWHLGFCRHEHLPRARGFSSHFGFWSGNLDFMDHTAASSGTREDYINVPDTVRDEKISFDGHNWVDNTTSRQDLVGHYLTDLLTERATDIVKNHNTTEPLFLLMAHHATHRGNIQKPVAAPEKYTKSFSYIKDETRRNFAGCLKALDDSVGEVMSALLDKGMLENSLVIFASDNGADIVGISAGGGSNWPLRGQKVTAWEGGVRLPAVVWSPDIKSPGRIWNGLMHVSDWLPTLYHFAGGYLEELPEHDGSNQWKPIAENLSSSRNEVLLILDPIWNMSALRIGDFKLVQGYFPLQDISGWYGVSGRETRSHFLNEPECTVARVFGQFHGYSGRIPHAPVVTLDCGQKPSDPEEQCNIKEEICIFNIKEDPCEYRNVAKKNKQMLTKLQERLKKFQETSVAPINTKRDYLANPQLHGGLWVPWRDST